MSAPLHAFAGYGIELEYMIVDRETLSIRPIADRLLRDAAGEPVNELERGGFGWSNELTLHLIELKNVHPDPDLEGLASRFQAEVRQVDAQLEPLGAWLLPSAMHPWMDPATETRLWPHAHAEIYAAYDRLFGCRQHGFANLQSQHLNLPFADDAEFARLHAAVRVVLPILPALAASSPIVEGRLSGLMDARLEAYRGHQGRIPETMGRVVPDTVVSRADYQARILEPMYRAVVPQDPDGLLQHEWLNARGVIPRFDRSALEIRLIDVQECPGADLAIAAAVTAVVRALYDEKWAPLQRQQAIDTDGLVDMLAACIRDAEEALIANADYLAVLGCPEKSCTARELWRHLIEAAPPAEAWQPALEVMLEQGPLARRLLRAMGPAPTRARLRAVYGELADCLAQGHMFLHSSS